MVAFCRKTAKRGDILAKNKIAEKRQLGCHFRLKIFLPFFGKKPLKIRQFLIIFRIVSSLDVLSLLILLHRFNLLAMM